MGMMETKEYERVVERKDFALVVPPVDRRADRNRRESHTLRDIDDITPLHNHRLHDIRRAGLLFSFPDILQCHPSSQRPYRRALLLNRESSW